MIAAGSGTSAPSLGDYAVIAVTLLLGVSAAFIAPVEIVSIETGIGVGPATAGIIVSGELMAVAIVASILAGSLPRLPVRRLVAMACLVEVISQGLSVLPSPPIVFGVLRVITGLASGVIYAAGCYWTARNVHGVRLFGLALAAASAAYGLGMLVLPSLVAMRPLAGLFAPMAALAVLGFAVFTRVTPPVANLVEDMTTDKPLGWPPHLWILLGSAFLSNVGLQMLWTFAEQLSQARGFSLAMISALLTTAILFNIAGSTLAGVVDQRWKIVPPLVGANLLAACAGLMVTYSTTAWGFGSGLCLYGLTYFFILPFQVMAGAALDPSGRCASLAGGAALLGSAVSPLAGGAMLTFVSPAAIGLFSAGLCLSAAALSLTLRSALEPSIALQPRVGA